MRRSFRFPLALTAALLLAGCSRGTDEAPVPPYGAGTPARIDRPVPSGGGDATAEVSWDTEADRRFAEFLRENSGGMVAKAAVGIANKGLLQVVLDESVAPEDTLDLTRALMSGARNDFPDRPITLKVFDPAEAPILTARYRPGQGVDYQLANAEGEAPGPGPGRDDEGATPGRGGVTELDREFAHWAEDTGRDFLRYVQADLERHGRLWFGVTDAVAPDDVPDLTRSLLEGARDDFPGRELRATVFDPEGERIGTATLGRDGRIRWQE